jgi:hypothetical protein
MKIWAILFAIIAFMIAALDVLAQPSKKDVFSMFSGF